MMALQPPRPFSFNTASAVDEMEVVPTVNPKPHVDEDIEIDIDIGLENADTMDDERMDDTNEIGGMDTNVEPGQHEDSEMVDEPEYLIQEYEMNDGDGNDEGLRAQEQNTDLDLIGEDYLEGDLQRETAPAGPYQTLDPSYHDERVATLEVPQEPSPPLKRSQSPREPLESNSTNPFDSALLTQAPIPSTTMERAPLGASSKNTPRGQDNEEILAGDTYDTTLPNTENPDHKGSHSDLDNELSTSTADGGFTAVGNRPQEDSHHPSQNEPEQSTFEDQRPANSAAEGHISHEPRPSTEDAKSTKPPDDAETENLRDGIVDTDTHYNPIVDYDGNELLLFQPYEHEAEQGLAFLLQDKALASLPLSELFNACRGVLVGCIDEREELEIQIPSLELVVRESSPESSAITLRKIVGIYMRLHQNDGNHSPETMRISLLTSVEFSRHMKYLQKAADAGQGFEQVARGGKSNTKSSDHVLETIETAIVESSDAPQEVEEDHGQQFHHEADDIALEALESERSGPVGEDDLSEDREDQPSEDGTFEEPSDEQAQPAVPGHDEFVEYLPEAWNGEHPDDSEQDLFDEEQQSLQGAEQTDPLVHDGRTLIPDATAVPASEDELDFDDEHQEAQDDSTRSSTLKGDPNDSSREPNSKEVEENELILDSPDDGEDLDFDQAQHNDDTEEVAFDEADEIHWDEYGDDGAQTHPGADEAINGNEDARPTSRIPDPFTPEDEPHELDLEALRSASAPSEEELHLDDISDFGDDEDGIPSGEREGADHEGQDKVGDVDGEVDVSRSTTNTNPLKRRRSAQEDLNKAADDNAPGSPKRRRSAPSSP